MQTARTLTALALVALCVLAAPAAPAAATDCIEGSGTAREENRTVPPFTALAVGGVFDVHLTVGPPQRVTLRGDDNILPHIRTTVSDGKLTVASDRSLCLRTDLRLDIRVPLLTGFESNGTVSLQIDGIQGERFDLSLGGSGEAVLAGRCERFDALLAGTAGLRAGDLEARRVSVRIAGAADAEVFAAERLDASISGMGTVTYAGRPREVNRAITGLGDVVPR